ncbi:Uncharacterised protein [Escherichia coli]|nr:Uncharacterised protein [Escherichia coli]
MSHRELFSEFLENLNLDLKQAKKISYHYRKITKSLNLAFRGTSSRVANRLKVGSVGRHTAIKGISDLDMLYIMPPNQYEYYNRKDNGQSALLTDVRNILAEEYPDQTVKKDRLVVQIIFKTFMSRFNLYSDRMMTALNSLKAIMEEHGALQNLFTKRRP